MRTCCAGQSVFHGTSKPHLSVARLSRLPIRLGDLNLQRKHAHSFRKLTPAAVSAPDGLLAQNVDSTCPKADETFALLERAVSSSNAERPSKSGVSGRETLEPPEELASTSGHRAIVGSAMLLLAGIGAQGFAGIHGSLEGASVCAAVAVAYVLAGNVDLICVEQFCCLVDNMPSLHSKVLHLFCFAMIWYHFVIKCHDSLCLVCCRLWHRRVPLVS